jgi:hypothetical protein
VSKPLSHQVIIRAREIINDPRNWIQSCHALFKNGRIAEPQ